MLFRSETSISSLSNAQTSLINKMAAKPITMENPFASANAIQVQIDDNVRMLANCMLGGKERMKLLETIK